VLADFDSVQGGVGEADLSVSYGEGRCAIRANGSAVLGVWRWG
jgi:hypothetical protein